MAIENTYLLGKNITLGCGFDLQAKAPLDSRQTVPSTAGLQALIDGNAAYEGMIVYDEESKKTYQAQIVDDVLAFREFGINEAELKDLIASETTAAMEFKGAATALPENPAKGDMYKATASFKVGEEDVKVGDSIVYDGEQWFIIPSGDDIEDTWRPVTGVDNDSTLTFVAGDKLEKTVAADGTITYKHVAIDAPEDMTAEDDEKTRTYITQLITDNHGHIIGFKTATENVEDTNTEYTFEGQSDEATSVYFQVASNEEGASAEVVYLDAYSKNEADGKFVAKETGKSLISDDEIARLAEVDNYNDEEVRGLIGDNAKAIEDLETYVGTIPNVSDEDGNNKYADLDVIGYINKKAQETLAAASGNSSETAASVKQQLDDYIGENNTRVKTAEDAIDAIEADYLKAADKTELANAIAGVKATADAAAVKTEVETALGGKVDKVEGKDLIATSEIERLATLANYDDTQVKADIAKKADAEAMTTELGKKVDKVEGKSLIADSEIARLANVDNYDDTAVKADIAKKADAATMTTELGKKVDKVEGYSLVADDEIARLADVDNYDDEEVRGLIGDNADAIAEIKADYVKAADIADFETKANVKKVADDLAAYVESNDAAVADRYTKEEADAKFALITDAYDDTELANRVKAIEDDYLVEADKTALQDQITANTNAITLLTDGADPDKVDSVKDLIDYVDKHGAEVTGMKADIAANAKAIEDHEALAAETYETKDDAAAKLAEAKEYADSINTALDARLDTLEAINHDAYTAADAALKAELQAEIDADVKALSDGAVATNATNIAANAEAIATKANSADVYTKTETYTQAEVDALIVAAHTWGEF